MLYVAARRLARVLDLQGMFATAAIFCVFLTQMLWAAIAHVGNDALSIPLVVLFLAVLPGVARPGKNTRRDFVFLCAVLAAGLLAKAYFLTFVPVCVALLGLKHVRASLTLRNSMLCVGTLAIAGAWYARNLAVYGSLSGTQESASGVTFGKAMAAFPKIHWLSSALHFAHWSLWTGDWSFVSFSKATLNMELLLIAAGMVMYGTVCRSCVKADAWILVACFCFLLGLIYQTCVTWVGSQGASQFAEPWYGQGILVCVWLLAFRGFQSARAPGRILAALLCIVSCWIALVTYMAKLPMFYATGTSRIGLHSAIVFWSAHPGDALQPIILGPVWLVYSSLTIFVIVTVLTMSAVLRGLFSRLCS